VVYVSFCTGSDLKTDIHLVDFRVSDIKHIEWNPKIFDSLELDPETKYMIRALIETQSSEDMKFDDFILGKGKGCIFNLHGSPGIGKTLTAEATSEGSSVWRFTFHLVNAPCQSLAVLYI